ncbi:MAG: PAS domain-containing protein [Ferruginibacter sp.]
MNFKRIILSDLIFLLIILLLTILSIFSYNRINTLNRQSDYVTHTNLVRLRLEQLLSYVKDAESGQRGFLITRDRVHLESYFEANNQYGKIVDDIDSLVRDSKEQQQNLKLLQWLVTKRMHRLNTGLGDASLDSATTADLVTDGKILMDQLRNLVSKMMSKEDKLLYDRTKQKNYSAFITPLYSLLLSVFAIFAVALSYFFLRTETRLRFHAQDSIKKLNDYFKDLPATFGIVKGKEHVFEMANNLFHNVTGNRTLIGKPLREALPELEGQELYKLIDKAYTSGELIIGGETQVQLDRGGGKLVEGYFNFIFKPILNATKEVAGILIFGYEITEMMEARKLVEETNQRSRLAIEAANIGTFDWDMEHNIFVSSPRLIEIFGFGKKEGVTHTELIERFHPEDKPMRDKAVEESITKGSLAYEARIICKDGSIRWVSVYGKIMHSGSKELLRMYGTALDVTEQRTIMQELRKSEAQFRLLADSMPQFVWTADVRGKLNYFSNAVLGYSGLPMKEFIDNGWSKFIHPEDKGENDRKWMNAVLTGEEYNHEHRLRNHEGEYRWHLSRALPQKGTHGELQRWVGTSTDIQDQKNLSQKLEQQVNERTKELGEVNKELLIKNNIFSQAEENALIGSYAWNLQTGALDYSDNLFRLFGYEPNEFVPSFEKYLSLIHPDDREQVIKNGEATMANKVLYANIHRVITKDGKIKHLRASGKMFGSGENAMLIGTVQDISQDTLLNEILRAKNLELEQSNAELESFNYIASHDLQEPLRKIQAFSQRILSKEGDNLTPFSKDYFSRINGAAERMQNLIDALLSYSRANSSILSEGPTNLNFLVNDVISDMQDTIDETQAVIQLTELPTLPVVSIQVNQIFVNILGNAIKYSRPGVAPVINISAKLVSGKEIPDSATDVNIKYWMISVADNGIGFEQRYEHKIFELFQRLHGSGDYIGTGIGLAICKKIMRNHQGFISAEGVPGTGSTFNIYFPVL